MVQPPPPPAAARPMLSPAQRYRTLGTTALVLGILELLYCLQRLLAQLFRGSIADVQRSMLPDVPGGPDMQAVMDAARDLTAKIALWETLRTIPFLVATGFLLWIALRIREGDARALFTARRWVLAAFAAIAVGVVIQVVWTLPAMAEYQRRIVGSIAPLAGGDATPVDVKELVSFHRHPRRRHGGRGGHGRALGVADRPLRLGGQAHPRDPASGAPVNAFAPGPREIGHEPSAI